MSGFYPGDDVEWEDSHDVRHAGSITGLLSSEIYLVQDRVTGEAVTIDGERLTRVESPEDRLRNAEIKIELERTRAELENRWDTRQRLLREGEAKRAAAKRAHEVAVQLADSGELTIDVLWADKELNDWITGTGERIMVTREELEALHLAAWFSGQNSMRESFGDY